MGILRRSRPAEGSAGPAADELAADELVSDGSEPDPDELDAATPEADEVEGPVGPTGRPLHPIGAYFEAAFRRFGINFGGYLLYTAACGLLPLGAALGVSAVAWPESLELFVFFLAFTLGNVLLIALTTALVSGGARDRLRPLIVTCAATGLLGAVLATFHPVIAVVFYPLIVFPPIAAASGDAAGLQAILVGAATAKRWFRRTYACMLGIAIVSVSVWFGFTILLSPLEDELQKRVAFIITALLVWPVSALVFRNLYGDVTGRLVINASPKEDQRRKEIMRRRRAKAKRNRERIKKVTGE